jgi:hypothetical protein
MSPEEVYRRFIAGESLSNLERVQWETRPEHSNDWAWMSADSLLREYLIETEAVLRALS